jgi:cell division protein FtsW
MARKLASDRILFAAFLALALLGCVMIYSASAPEAMRMFGNPYRYLAKQLAALIVGLTLAFVVSRIDHRHFRRPFVVYGGLAGCLLLCVAVLFRPPINAARRWIVVGPLTLQPAEFLKVALVLFLAYQIDRKRERLDDFVHGMLPALTFLGLAAAIVLAEPDLGTATSYLLVAATLFYLAGAPLKYFALGAAGCVPVLALLVLSAGYRKQRFLAFLHPEADPLGRGFQAAQSLIAVGTGGITGNGEELGFIGAIAVIALFGVVAWRGLRAARRAPEPHLAYLAVGATAMIVLQAAINLGVVLTLLPTKGIPLPFLSYGGSSLVADCLAAGILLNVSQHVT